MKTPDIQKLKRKIAAAKGTCTLGMKRENLKSRALYDMWHDIKDGLHWASNIIKEWENEI